MRLLGVWFFLLGIYGAEIHWANAAEFTFENVEIPAVLSKASELTGLAFLYDPAQVKGRITLYASDKVSPDEVLQLLRSALAIHGYSLVQKDKTVWIVPGEQAPHLEVVSLGYAKAEDLAAALARMAPYGVRIVPYSPTNSLILYGDPHAVKELIQVIKGSKAGDD